MNFEAIVPKKTPTHTGAPSNRGTIKVTQEVSEHVGAIDRADPQVVVAVDLESLWDRIAIKKELPNVRIVANGIKLEGQRLAGLDLSESSLVGAELQESDLSGANLSGADLRGACLIGANLRGANLNGATIGLHSTELQGANLIGLQLETIRVVIHEKIGPETLGMMREFDPEAAAGKTITLNRTQFLNLAKEFFASVV